jgi:hypothetical protein
MLNPDDKTQGVLVATGVNFPITEVPEGSYVDVGRRVGAGCEVVVCVLVHGNPVKGGTGPQEAGKMRSIKIHMNMMFFMFSYKHL